MNVLEDIIRKVEAAAGDVRAQAVITAEFAVALQTESIRERLRAALDAAAVLRWFDVQLLGRLLEIGEVEARVASGASARHAQSVRRRASGSCAARRRSGRS